ncbi:hypothetical protein TNIN_445171 [Trichonephila inaurata madagascariensis]|uniref:Uncharacterized protein n=1 Tax=Trichonephila inaurata madagascariensis TaxID=2747483 RepID=A0A8X7CI45_9ARAC|nr:hypothetical protein TNIN_445171 [Trichonephila inaurata madagascariensis]
MESRLPEQKPEGKKYPFQDHYPAGDVEQSRGDSGSRQIRLEYGNFPTRVSSLNLVSHSRRDLDGVFCVRFLNITFFCFVFLILWNFLSQPTGCWSRQSQNKNKHR